MTDTGYRPRVVDALISEILDYSGGLLLEGVRACGKTMTGRQHAASEVALDSGLPQIRAALDLDPALLLEGDIPRLIDELQLAPDLWNAVRREVDARQRPGQFILTGSSVPAEDATRHSGAHRISRVRLRPMTLFEPGARQSRCLGWGLSGVFGVFAGVRRYSPVTMGGANNPETGEVAPLCHHPPSLPCRASP